ncbi:MAG: hypothetical protein FWH32_04960 [Clostridiales bacterium]|nr:hypothetical protein [Clostridiales bacterium]
MTKSNRKKRKVLVIGSVRIPLYAPKRMSQAAQAAGNTVAGIKEAMAPLMKQRLNLGGTRIPIVFFLVAVLAIVPLMAFGAGNQGDGSDATDDPLAIEEQDGNSGDIGDDKDGATTFFEPEIKKYTGEITHDSALSKWVRKVDRDVDGNMENVYISNDLNTDVVTVKNGDVVFFRIDVFNQGANPIFISEIIDQLPEGLRFDPSATIAHVDSSLPPYNNDLWELVAGAYGEPDSVRYKGPKIFLPGWDGNDDGFPEHRLPIVLIVDVPEDITEAMTLGNFAEITKLETEAGADVAYLAYDDDSRDHAYLAIYPSFNFVVQ